MSETRNRFRAWLEHERGLGAYTFVSEHNMYQAYKEATYAERERGQAEVARLREALRLIYIRADTAADEYVTDICEAVLFTPTESSE